MSQDSRDYFFGQQRLCKATSALLGRRVKFKYIHFTGCSVKAGYGELSIVVLRRIANPFPVCSGQRFESSTLRQGMWCNGNITVSKTADGGSIPLLPANAPLAQMAEHMTFNHGVWSSNLQGRTKQSISSTVRTRAL